jgi:ADP-ribosylglycohydrolase
LNPKLNASRGCLLGALIGDATGAKLEFIGHRPTDQEVTDTMTMPGGGVWRVAPGQITDDGELALALARALVGASSFPALQVACSYVSWMNSSPFDAGITTRKALEDVSPEDPELLKIVLENASRRNMASKANGSVMRASPLGIWSTRLSVEQTVDAARLDSRLTHPNLACQWAEAAYVVAIRHLILNPGQGQEAFASALDVVNLANEPEALEVLSWLEDARLGRLPPCHPLAGFVKIAFTHAFVYLNEATPFDVALQEVMRGGGDTDTNACIVGGLLGALHGMSGLPKQMVDTLLNCDTQLGQPRPKWLTANDAVFLADDLVRQ